MTPKERQLWLARHHAPANMRLVTDLELTVITNGLHEVQEALKQTTADNAKLVDQNQNLHAKVAELQGAIALGQENCDDAYDDLRAERDQKQALLDTALASVTVQANRADKAERERDEALKQAKLAWERHAEKDRAYGVALKERDALEIAIGAKP